MNDLQDLFMTGLRRSATHPNIYGFKPHELQEQFLRAKQTGRLFLGGNRSGKTVGGAVETIYRLRGEHPYQPVHPAPIYARGTAVDIEQGLKKIMLPELRKWIPPSLLVNGSWEDSYHNQSRTLTCTNGSMMDFLTGEMETDRHAGTSRHFIWFDEEPPKHIYNEDLLRLVDVKGKWILTMTPVEGMTWVYDEIYKPVVEDEDPETMNHISVTMVSTIQNPHIDPQVLDDMTRGMSEEEKNARRHGQFMAASGLIYPEFTEKYHTVDPLDYTQLRHLTVVCGMDHGLRNPSCWLWAVVDAEGRITVFECYYQSEKVVAEHSDYIKAFEDKYQLSPSYRIGDPAIAQRSAHSGRSIQSEYADNGIYIGTGNNDVGYGLNRVRFLWQNSGLFITNNCQPLIKELRNYRWETWATKKSTETKEPKDKPRKVKDHAVDALRYLVCSRPEAEFTGPAGHLYLPFSAPVQVPGGPVTEKDYYNEPNSEYHEILGDEW